MNRYPQRQRQPIYMKRERIEHLINSLKALRLQEDRLIAEIQRELAIEPQPTATASASAQGASSSRQPSHPDGHVPPRELQIGDRVRYSGTRTNPAGVGTIDSWLSAGYCWIKRDSKRGLFGTERVRRLTTNVFLLDKHE